MSEWQPIETAPKDETPVDLWRGKWNERATSMYRVELEPGNVFYEPLLDGPCVVRDATHWMPVPPPPSLSISHSEGAKRGMTAEGARDGD